MFATVALVAAIVGLFSMGYEAKARSRAVVEPFVAKDGAPTCFECFTVGMSCPKNDVNVSCPMSSFCEDCTCEDVGDPYFYQCVYQ